MTEINGGNWVVSGCGGCRNGPEGIGDRGTAVSGTRVREDHAGAGFDLFDV